MRSRTWKQKATAITASWLLLGATVACGFGDDDDDEEESENTAPAGAIALSPGFTPDPHTESGTAGGPVSASTRNQACRGYIPATAQHTVHTSAAMNNLRVIVNAGAVDTTLVVQLSNGQYLCDDDGGEGTNPIVQGAFPAGVHQVFVGSYRQGVTTPYNIGFTELSTLNTSSIQAPAGAAVPTPPPGGGAMISLTPGFIPDPQTARGTAGGTMPGSSLNPQCRGYLPSSPQHTVNVTSDFRNLRVMVNSAMDTTLVMRGPDGRYYCDDDGGGNMNPLVESALGPGAYQVWVGTYQSGQAAPYVIGFSELSSVTPASLGN